jgi:archaellum biogenesis protein FlaJ (TadC family)
MEDKIFRVDIERSRIYWDYYRSMFIVFSFALMAGMISTAIIYMGDGIELVLAVGIMLLLFLFIILLAALMSLTIWRHENRHLDELIAYEADIPPEDVEPDGMPLV